MGAIYIRSWDKREDVFLWKEGKALSVPKNESPLNTDGFFKKFFVGKNVVVVKNEGEWEVCIGSDVFFVRDIECVVLRKYSVINRVFLKVSGSTYKFYDYNIMDFFTRKFDPTYDFIDEELVFGFWLKELVSNIR